MATRVEGRVVRRPLDLSSFEDITGPEIQLVTPIRGDYLEFDGDLTEEQRQAIKERMTSKNDVDQEERATIRALMVEHPDCVLAVALATYVLDGDT